MKAGYTHITWVIDRSGSMASIQDQVIAGYNSFIEGQKGLEGTMTMTSIQFESGTWSNRSGTSSLVYDVVENHSDIVDVKRLSRATYRPGGGTPLLDALGRAIKETGSWLASLPESERPEKVLFMIYTDGEENSSREYTAEQIKALIEHQESKYSWQFSYLGANQDSFAEADKLGIRRDATGNFSATAEGTLESMSRYTQSVAAYRAAPAAAAFCMVKESK